MSRRTTPTRAPGRVAALGGLMLAASAWAGPPPPPPPPPSSTPAPQPAPQPKPEPRPEPAPPCPDDGQWKGHPPPHGDAYYCAVRVESGALQKHGWYVKFYPNGNVQEECEYAQDVRHGRCTFYRRDGVRKSRGFYANGHFTNWWWFWDVLDHVPAGDAVARRDAVQDLLIRMGAPADDVAALAQHVLDSYPTQRSDIRQANPACTPAVCVQAATVASRGMVAIQLSPPESRIDAGKTHLWRAKKRAKKEKSRETWRAKSAAKKVENSKRAYERALLRWKATPLACNDGSSSGSCICGGSGEGCCAYAGGVKGCPREKPTPPK